MANLINFTTPTGRIVMGDLYKPQTKDMDGKPLTVKQGPNAGQPTVKYFFALAIAKEPGKTHWSHTGWGAAIWKAGHDLFGAVADSPMFAWKVVDGDSQIPNSKGVKPCDRQGYPGHWVLSFSSQYAPSIYFQASPGNWEPYTVASGIKTGYFVQVNANIASNQSSTKPGLFLYHSMVGYIARGEEIYNGPDVSEVGFGQGPLPTGALPIENEALTAFTLGAQPNNASLPPQMAAVPPPPNPAILMPPVPRRMTPQAGGFTYEQMIAAGWSDEMLIKNGMMLA